MWYGQEIKNYSYAIKCGLLADKTNITEKYLRKAVTQIDINCVLFYVPKKKSVLYQKFSLIS